jgi:hypothetical protein
MFQKAARQKLRFESIKGQLTVEDLWDLPLTSAVGKANLDDIARDLHRQLKSGDNVSFVNTAEKSDETIQLKFDIVKHVIDTKLAENTAVALERDTREKRQRLLALIEQKENEQLMGSSMDELKAMLQSMK